MPRSTAWHAALQRTIAAREAWLAHKASCDLCTLRNQRPCEAGRQLLHRLWACQQAQSDAWHRGNTKPGMEALF